MKAVFIVILTSIIVFPASTDDLSLSYSGAAEYALANSDELGLALIGLEIAREKLKASKRIYFPYLTVRYEDGNKVVYNGSDSVNHNLTFEAEQMLFDGGKNAARTKLSESQIEIQQLALGRKKDELLDTVWIYYNSILVLTEKCRIQEENFKLAGDQLVIAGKQFELGEIRKIDLIETELEITNLRQSILDTNNQLSDAWFDFKRLLGIPSETEVFLSDSIDRNYNGLEITAAAEEIYRQALTKSMELKNIDSQIFQKEKELGFIRRTYIPELSATVGLTFSGTRFPLGSPSLSATLNIAFPDPLLPFSASLSATTASNSRSVSGSGSVPVAENISGSSSKKEIKTMISSLHLQKDMYKKNLLTEISRQIRAYNALREKLSITRKSLKLQQTKLMIYSKQFELGGITSLELLETRNELVATETGMLEQILEIIQNERSFENIMGLPAGSFYRITGMAREKEYE